MAADLFQLQKLRTPAGFELFTGMLIVSCIGVCLFEIFAYFSDKCPFCIRIIIHHHTLVAVAVESSGSSKAFVGDAALKSDVENVVSQFEDRLQQATPLAMRATCCDQGQPVHLQSK